MSTEAIKHGYFKDVTLEKRTVVPLTMQGFKYITSNLQIRESDPQYLDLLRKLLAGETLELTQEQHRASREAGGGFLHLHLEVPELMDPYWIAAGKPERFDLDIYPVVDAIHQTSGVMMINALSYCAAKSVVLAEVSLEVFHFIGRKFVDDEDLQQHGKQRAIEHLKDWFWVQITESQYIPVGDNGLYRENPNWGRYRTPSFSKSNRRGELQSYLNQAVKDHENT